MTRFQPRSLAPLPMTTTLGSHTVRIALSENDVTIDAPRITGSGTLAGPMDAPPGVNVHFPEVAWPEPAATEPTQEQWAAFTRLFLEEPQPAEAAATAALLVLAAKAAMAAGLDLVWGVFGAGQCWLQPDPVLGGLKPWNPLTDDGDRHRLLVSLKMTLAHQPSRGGWSCGAVVDGAFSWLAYDEDEARAVVVAAGAIGKAMP